MEAQEHATHEESFNIREERTNKERKSYHDFKKEKNNRKSAGAPIILMLILSAACFTAGGYAGHTLGFKGGQEAGYTLGHSEGESSGRSEGYIVGFAEGKQTGWNIGLDFGNKTGYTTGYQEGQQTGFSEGYTTGEADGFDTGYDAGFAAGFSETGWQIRDPTLVELKSFLKKDTTDQNTYQATYYDCEDFAADVKSNAFNAGYRCFYVVMEFSENAGHAILAFNTKDAGLKYVEPQSDEIVNVKIGELFPRTQYTVLTIRLIP